MKLVPEIGIAQLAKKGEELCGDTVEINRTLNDTIFVLSDGLGSGVKANILSTLTAKITANMMRRNVPVQDVIETIIQTLPICKVRQMAYSTFTILKFHSDGFVQLFEYDGPPVLKISNGNISMVTTKKRMISGKIINEAFFQLQEKEILVVVSDGITQAGLGGILPLGLGTEGLIDYIKKHVDLNTSAQEISNQIINLCEALYTEEPGDDSTVAVLNCRQSKEAVVFTGPPQNKSDDSSIVKELMHKGKVKIVCGGTTANIVSRELNKPLSVDLSYINSDIPPIAKLEGIDLVTEGILTMNRGLDLLEKGAGRYNSLDAANLLVKELLACDKVKFIVGTTVNPAHQNPELPLPLGLRKSIVEKWKEKLESRGKLVEIIWY